LLSLWWLVTGCDGLWLLVITCDGLWWLVINQVAASDHPGSKGLAMKNFQDPTLSSGVFLLHLLSTIRGIVNWDLVSFGSSATDKLANCQYVIRCALCGVGPFLSIHKRPC
jgi:hypothetical protein